MAASGGNSFDIQITGVVDDGSDEGLIKARVDQGETVRVPFREGAFVNGGHNAGWSQTFPENGDGSATGIFVNPPSNALTGGYIAFRVYGRTVGIRWNAGYSASSKALLDFGVMIDKIAYPVHNLILTPDTQVSDTAPDVGNVGFFVRDLPDGPHLVEIYCPPPVAGSAVSAQYRIFGFLGDRVAGYENFHRPGVIGKSSMLTTSPVDFHFMETEMQVVTVKPRALRGVVYVNTDTVPHVVTVQKNSVDGGLVTMWQTVLSPAGAPLSTAQFPGEHLGDFYVAWLLLSHFADANNVVRATPIKVY